MDPKANELISELSSQLLESTQKIGELDKANTFLKFKLKHQVSESEKMVKKYQAKIAKMQEEITKLTKAAKQAHESPSQQKERYSVDGSNDPAFLQRWPEIYQTNPAHKKVSPKQVLAAPRSANLFAPTAPSRRGSATGASLRGGSPSHVRRRDFEIEEEEGGGGAEGERGGEEEDQAIQDNEEYY